MQADPKQVKYSIQGMDCADCALSLERSLAQIEGVENVSVNFTTGMLEAHGNFEPHKLVQRVTALGYKVDDPMQADRRQPETKTSQLKGRSRLPGFFG